MVASSAVVAAINLVIAVLIITTPPKSSLAVPNVEGKSQSEAQATLRSLKLRSVVRREFNDLEAELVATQVPVTGRLNEGQAVTLIVSKGPRPVDIPDLAAVTSEQDAFNTLLNAGLQPGIVYRREDPRALAGQVLDWSLKGTRQPRGTAVDITFSTGPAGATSAAPQSPLMLSQPGAVGEGRYITDAFVPRVTVTLNPGWVVDTAGPDRVSLSRADRPSSRVSFVRVHRVYNPVSPNNERQQLATTDDALNSVQDIRDLQGDLAEFLATHPNRLPGLGGIRSTTRAGRSGSEVDAQFRPYAYNGCRSVTNMCAPIFQLYDEAGRTSSFPFVGTEVARFEIFRIVSGAHLVMVTSALDIDFKNFVSEARSLLNVEQFEFTDRIATVRVRSSTNPSEENALVTLTADAGPVCSVGRVLFSTAAPDSLMPLGSAELVNGTAMLVVTFQGQGGRARVVAEYEGDCARGVSAPLFQRVT
ncbi:MAG: PASTA domain-containing protein [Acidimicrobiales bacterium]